MGYIDKEKMLHEISVKKGQCLKNGWDMLYASMEETEKYVKGFHEAEIEDPVEVVWLKKEEHCLVRIDGKFYEARRATIKDSTDTEYLEVHFQIDREAKTEADT